MAKWKPWRVVLFTIFCILLNIYGQKLASHFQLFLWLDSYGTVLSAYLGGPLCGSIIGLTSNLIVGMSNHQSWLFAPVSVAIGCIVGICSRKKMLETLQETLTIALLITLASVVVAVPINFLISGGSTGNIWGNAVISFFSELHLPYFFCALLGQFYIDFVDKALTLILLHQTILFIRFYNKKNQPAEELLPENPIVLSLTLFLLTGLLIGFVPAESKADTTDYSSYVQTIYSSTNGLPCGEANDIVQDNDGILWIGTYAGLYRYNGTEFTWIDDYDSVRNVNCLYVDDTGRLWIGTNDNGLSIAIHDKVVNVIDQSTGLPSNSVRSIIESSDGYYYIGTTSSMQVLTLNGGLKKTNTLWEINYADNSSADTNGHVSVVTQDGRMFLLGNGQILSSLQIPGGNEEYNCSCFDADGLLWAGTSTDRVLIYDISGGHFDLKKEYRCEGLSHINDLSFLPTGELFVASDSGIGYFDEDLTFHTVNTNSFNNSIDNILFDYQSNLWLTSSRLGLLRLAASSFHDIYSAIGMETRVVNAVEFWQNQFYIGTDRGLDVVDGELKKQIRNDLTDALKGVRIRCLLRDSRDSLWICTYGGGLIEVEPDGTQHLYNNDNGSFGNRARMVTELSTGVILAAGDTGISFIQNHEILKTIGYADGLINSMILTAVETRDGTILAGTDGDGIAVIKDGEVTHMLKKADGLSSEVILRLYPDPASDGFFIVTSNGLCYMDETWAIRFLSNFPYFNNYDMYARDEHKLFVMSSGGLYIVDRDELLSGNPLVYDLLDNKRGLNSALTANSWSYHDAEGNLYLPCDTGVFVINTEKYASSIHSYRMSIPETRFDGEASQSLRGTTISIGRNVGRIELYPEIVNYTIQDPYVGYYLENFDADWSILPLSDLKSIVYTNLPTGTYSLHLAVFDTDKQNILEERIYTLIKQTELYDQPYFILYVVVVALLAVISITAVLVYAASAKERELQRREIELSQKQIQMGNETILAIANAVDAKDVRTSEHSYRVAVYSEKMARYLGYSDEECKNIERAARMHDIGKIGIPDAILNKPGRLDDDEYAQMKTHVTRGAKILSGFTLIDHIVEGALYHHERYDGRGYPEGLKGEEIPLYGRLIGVADAFDAMTANRVYRKQMDFDYVLNEMKKGRGTQFDPQFVDVLLKLIEIGEIDLNALYSKKQEPADENAKPAPAADTAKPANEKGEKS